MKILHSRAFSNHTTRVSNLEILGLPENASVHEIKAAYLRLCKELHPDVNQSPLATEQFQKIKLAYDQLQSEKSGNAATSSSSSSSERDHSYSHSTEFQAWKAKQRRTRDFDDWLRKVQNQGRNQRVKKSRSTDEEFSSNEFKTSFSKTNSDFSQSRQKFYNFEYEEKSREPDKSYQTEAYLRYEKNFIARLDFLLGLVQKKMNPEFNINDHQQKINKAHYHYLAPYIFRVVMRTVVYVSLVVAVISSVLGWLILLKTRSVFCNVIDHFSWK